MICSCVWNRQSNESGCNLNKQLHVQEKDVGTERMRYQRGREDCIGFK